MDLHDTSSSKAAAGFELPSGYELIGVLSERASADRSENVVRARWRGRDVIVRAVRTRSDSEAARSETAAELAVLAAVEHPGLASLLDHGSLPEGRGSYVTRAWIEGEELDRWAAGRSAEDVARLIARLCVALEHLHAAGFVHCDLKASNVIVTPARDGVPAQAVLTDFGLAGRSGATREQIAGTLFHVAPEVLLDGAAQPRSDLFALGALLHQLWITRRASAREFYGRFPQSDFFAASGTSPEELPSFARDLVAALLEREPDRRPASAAAVGRTLAGRLGLAGLFHAARPTLSWPVRRGREDWCASWWSATRAAVLERAGTPSGAVFQWLVFPVDEAPTPLLEGLALHAALEGARVRRVDLREELRAVLDTAALDAWASALARTSRGELVFLAREREDEWSRRALEAAARAFEQAAPERNAPAPGDEGRTRAPVLILGGHGAPEPRELAWTEWRVPEVSEEDVVEFLRAELAEPPDDPRTAQLARVLHASAGGSASALERALQSCIRDGWLVGGDERPRLRSGALPAHLALEPEDERAGPAPISRGGPAARLLAASRLLGEQSSLARAGELGQVSGAALARALESLAAAGLARVQVRGEVMRVEALRGRGLTVRSLLSEDEWREIHGRRARSLEAEGAPRSSVLPHAYRARAAKPDEVAAEAAALRERGCAERSLELCERALEADREAGAASEPALLGERALSWCALGQADRALEELASLLAGEPGPRQRALAERVRGQVAQLRHEPRAALEHFERALELDPEGAADARLAKARLFYELRRHEELCAFVRELQGSGRGPREVPERTWANLLALEAMALFRMGEIGRARGLLEGYAAEARAAGDALREAGLLINLATVARRAGDLGLALASFEQAAVLYDRAGLVSGLAQARAMLGSSLRDTGELARAEPLLASALAIRERLGDRVGATLVRGMLGLLHAERGRARSALEELGRSARLLREDGRSSDAGLLEARAAEVRARIGARAQDPRSGDAEAGPSEALRSFEGDPRVLISLARADLFAGESARARERIERARDLASSLGLGAVQEEAAFLARWLASASDGPQEAASGQPAGEPTLVREDEELFARLARAPFDEGGARALAERLASRGRDDRAARLYLALAVRAQDRACARQDAESAEAALASCVEGLSAHEAASLRRNLLGLPDPWPEDLTAFERRANATEDLEMEVLDLLEINHRLLAEEDLPTLLGAIVEQALAVSGAQRGFLILEEDGELAFDTALDSRRGDIAAPEVEVSRSVLREALEKMRPLRVSNAVDDPELGAAPSVIALELRSILCVPFRLEKDLRGVIYVDHRLREGAFGERAERVLGLLADQAALAILQVRRLEEIRRLNRELQRQVVTKESQLKTAHKALEAAGLPAPAGALVGNSPAIREVHRLIERAAPSRLAILISGESGTGKELCARALHERSPRSGAPFVGENCAALPASLIEAELFGTRRGAYTGADRDREGLFERAHGGTLFLDEIGELPLELQAKLLRVIETSEVRQLGGASARTVDFRLVAASNRDLAAEVRAGGFRADLYYRLNGLEIRMPSLAQSVEDIPALVDHYLRLAERQDGKRRSVGPSVLAALCRRPWPGNVRELFNELARLCVMSEGDLDDPGLVRTADAPAAATSSGGAVRSIAALEREAIESALRAAGGDKRRAAAMLGISRAKIYQRLKDWKS